MSALLGGTTVEVRRRTFLRAAVAVVVVLNVLNALTIARGVERGGWLLLAFERNPSTWFAAALFAAAAAVAWTIGRSERGSWNLLAATLLLMSVDEVATVHEKLGSLPGLPGIGDRAWLAGGLLLAAIVAVRLLPWVLGLPAPLRLAVVGGGAVFLLGAVGTEQLAAMWSETHGEDRTFFVLSSVEEDLEMAGILWVAVRLLDHARAVGATLSLRFS